MTVRQKAVKWAAAIASDDSHGYDQGSRWGPDYDCSSLVISAYKQAGVPLTCTYTGNMYSDMIAHGFVEPTGVNLSNGYGLEPGDVLLAHNSSAQHTAMYVGGEVIVHAAGNEYGKATGGHSGDQTGKEICARSYYNCPWDHVLRYAGEESKPVSSTSTYTVQRGDSLWSISEKLLGSGVYYGRIMNANNLSDSTIYPGQVLTIPDGDVDEMYRTMQVTVTGATYIKLNAAATKSGKTIGQTIDDICKAI